VRFLLHFQTPTISNLHFLWYKWINCSKEPVLLLLFVINYSIMCKIDNLFIHLFLSLKPLRCNSYTGTVFNCRSASNEDIRCRPDTGYPVVFSTCHSSLVKYEIIKNIRCIEGFLCT
jgi:hypothetical protein